MSRVAILAALLLAVGSAGCCCGKNWCWWNSPPEQAWRFRKWMFEGVACKGSFKAGFKAGYRFASCGGDACEPPVPLHYWRINGCTNSDRANARAWCDGFTHGTLAAQQDGSAGMGALDQAAAQPPVGIPDVNYYYPNAGDEFPNVGEFGAPYRPMQTPTTSMPPVPADPNVPAGTAPKMPTLPSAVGPSIPQSAPTGLPRIDSTQAAPASSAVQPAASAQRPIDGHSAAAIRRPRVRIQPRAAEPESRGGPSSSAAWQLPVIRD